MNQKVLLLIIVLAVAFGGYFVYQQQTKSTPVTQTVTQPTLSDETANWKTYTNSDYNFSLKYPKQFTLEVKSYPGKSANYENDRQFGLYRLVFYVTEDGVKGYSYYTISLHTSSNKTLAEQFPDKSLKPLNDNHGADEAAVSNFKSNEPGSRDENFTQQFFRVKDTVFEILPGLQEFTAADKIWNYPVLETLKFTD